MDFLDKNIPLKKRQDRYQKEIDKKMNPVPMNKFNPDTFDPMGDDMTLVANRKKELPPKKLPTYGLKPKQIRRGQMVGMFESKQDIYLILAHRCNQMQEEIDNLKKQLKKINK